MLFQEITPPLNRRFKIELSNEELVTLKTAVKVYLHNWDHDKNSKEFLSVFLNCYEAQKIS